MTRYIYLSCQAADIYPKKDVYYPCGLFNVCYVILVCTDIIL